MINNKFIAAGYLLLIELIRRCSSCIPMDILKKIPVIGKVKLHISDNIKVYMQNNGDDYIASVIFWRGIQAFEPETIACFIKLLESARTVLDIGANTGLYALIAGIENKERKVYAFEPVPAIFDYLKKNGAANNAHNVLLYQQALTNYNGEITIYIPEGNIPTEASTRKDFRKSVQEIRVKALRVDDFVNTENIPKIDLIKIDTEGTEDTVFQGAVNTIKRDKPLIICEVLKGAVGARLKKLFDPLGYAYIKITRKGLIEQADIIGDEAQIERDYLFVPREQAQHVLHRVNTCRHIN
ncbi:MAG: FkbM family methyltransferase [bacterium]